MIPSEALALCVGFLFLREICIIVLKFESVYVIIIMGNVLIVIFIIYVRGVLWKSKNFVLL